MSRVSFSHSFNDFIPIDGCQFITGVLLRGESEREEERIKQSWMFQESVINPSWRRLPSYNASYEVRDRYYARQVVKKGTSPLYALYTRTVLCKPCPRNRTFWCACLSACRRFYSREGQSKEKAGNSFLFFKACECWVKSSKEKVAYRAVLKITKDRVVCGAVLKITKDRVA